jgi:hypothetical protein
LISAITALAITSTTIATCIQIQKGDTLRRLPALS